MISEDRTRKLSIDAAVAKELKRREFVVWCLWGLIALAFTLTGWILYQGYDVKSFVELLITENPEPVAKTLSSNPEFLAASSAILASKPVFLDKTSDILASKPVFLDKTSDILASKTDMQKRITSLLSKDEEFQKSITRSTAFTESVAAELERNDDFVSRIAKAVPKGTHISKLQKRLSSLELELSDVRQQLEKKVEDEVAEHQRNITDIKATLTHLEKSQISGMKKIDNIERQLLLLTRDIEALKSEYAPLPRNYLLKTNQWNDLAALGMKVKIGRKIGEALSEFSVQKEGSLFCNKSKVQVGRPFTCKIETDSYQIELIYFVTRFFVADYVGMEFVLVP